MPRYWKRCTIRGWWPVLVTGHTFASKPNDTNDVKKYASFKPWFPFGTVISNGWFYSDQRLCLGGYSTGTFSLSSLYAEHLTYRNRWSQSNCGYDLACYKGTKLYMLPHQTYDYIVYVDQEYKSFTEWLKQCMHPGVLITHPKARVVRSIKNAGPRRKMPKMFIPPPTTMNTGWQWMNNIATEGLFAWFVTWLDLDAPWIGNVDDPSTVKWWSTGDKNSAPDWVKHSTEMQGKDISAALNAFYSNNSNVNNQWENLGYGPFILKGIYNTAQEHRVDYPQITFFYKSYWQWGGSTTTFKTVCDPKDPGNAQVYRKHYQKDNANNERWPQS